MDVGPPRFVFDAITLTENSTMITDLIDDLNNLVGSGAYSATIRARLNTLREQAEALEQEHATSKEENTELQKRVSQPQQSLSDAKGADTCPYCKRVSGVLEDIKPDDTFGDFGVKTHYYRCVNPKCGKTYDKRVDPPEKPTCELS